MDWGLLRPSNTHRGLRDVLMLKMPWRVHAACTRASMLQR